MGFPILIKDDEDLSMNIAISVLSIMTNRDIKRIDENFDPELGCEQLPEFNTYTDDDGVEYTLKTNTIYIYYSDHDFENGEGPQLQQIQNNIAALINQHNIQLEIFDSVAPFITSMFDTRDTAKIVSQIKWVHNHKYEDIIHRCTLFNGTDAISCMSTIVVDTDRINGQTFDRINCLDITIYAAYNQIVNPNNIIRLSNSSRLLIVPPMFETGTTYYSDLNKGIHFGYNNIVKLPVIKFKQWSNIELWPVAPHYESINSVLECKNNLGDEKKLQDDMVKHGGPVRYETICFQCKTILYDDIYIVEGVNKITVGLCVPCIHSTPFLKYINSDNTYNLFRTNHSTTASMVINSLDYPDICKDIIQRLYISQKVPLNKVTKDAIVIQYNSITTVYDLWFNTDRNKPIVLIELVKRR